MAVVFLVKHFPSGRSGAGSAVFSAVPGRALRLGFGCSFAHIRFMPSLPETERRGERAFPAGLLVRRVKLAFLHGFFSFTALILSNGGGDQAFFNPRT